MLSFIKDMFQLGKGQKIVEQFNDGQKNQIAAATLFIEIAKADSNISSEEYNRIENILKRMFQLNNEQLQELMKLAEDWIARSISLYEFTEVINKHFSADEKYELVKSLWSIVYADSILDKYEEHLVRIISNNFLLSHKDMIAAKLEVKKDLQLD